MLMPPSEAPPARSSRFVGFALALAGLLATFGLVARAGAPSALQASRDTSKAGITVKADAGLAWAALPDAMSVSATDSFNAVNPFYEDPSLRDHVKLTITPSSVGCGDAGKALVRPFYTNSGSNGDTDSFRWCEGGSCYLTLEMGGDVLHHDVGMVRMRGCPIHEGYTIPYLRIMKVLLGSYSTLYLGWGACDQAESDCAIGTELTMKPGECKTLSHPNKPSQNYNVCYGGPGHF